MREIKFRAWDKVTKRYYVVSGLEYDESGELCEVYLEGIKIDESDYYANLRKPSDVILEQYTGLGDKNGKEIYEGDIITDEDSCGKVWTSEVVYDDVYAEFACDAIGKPNCWSFEGANLDKLEVIDNIHENPELLEAKE